MGRRRRQPQGADASTEIDSVAEEFGNEYSEETLNLLRGVERPPYLEETSSLDPVDDLDLYVEHGLQIPPATYDALQKVGQEDMQQLQAAKDFIPDAATQDTIRYRQRLAEGTNHQDMTWLKLRAYHRAMDQLNASSKQDKAEHMAERLQEYEVPVDKVPADLMAMTPAQLAERQRIAMRARSRAASKAQKSRDAIQRILSQPDPSEESEWVAPSTQSPVLAAAAEGLYQALASHKGSLRLLPIPQEPSIAGEQGQQAPEEAAPVTPPTAPPAQQWQGRTIYTQAYLDQQALSRRVQNQQRQRSAAFWVSCAVVSGAYAMRLVRRHLLKKHKPPAQPPAAKLQPRPSDAASAGSRQQRA